MMMSIIGFLVILAPLVIVHELGHFLFAKLFNVKVETFSVGFGPRLFKKQIGETEFCLSAIPLGGFVKLLGEEMGSDIPAADLKRSLPRQAPWKRFFIFFGGPLFNFIFAALVFMAIVAIGEPQLSNTIGRVIPRSEAYLAGFRSGDRVTTIDGISIRKFSEIGLKIAQSPSKELTFGVERVQKSSTSIVVIPARPSSENGFSQYGEETQVGKIDGIFPFARSTKVGVSDPQSLAGKMGLRTGDFIDALNGIKVKNWEQIEDAYRELGNGESVRLDIRSADGGTKSLTLSIPAGPRRDLGKEWGIHSSELFIEKVLDDSPAMKAGLQIKDRIISINRIDVQSFLELKDRIQAIGQTKAPIDLKWERDGKVIQASIVPNQTEGKDVLLNKTSSFTIGIVPLLDHAKPETITERITNPLLVVVEGSRRMLTFTWRNMVSIGKMFTGDVSVKSLGGPILIGKLAGDSLERGLIEFLTTMAILSVGLGILNVLPIPVLDGGHLLLLGIEVIRRKPLTIRQMEIVQQVGLSIILLLMVVVFRNDIMRL